MTNAEFQEILKARLASIETISGKKDGEYSSNDDRLHVFKEAGRITDTTPEKALWGMFLKHFVSVQDMVHGRQTPTLGMIDEKIGDAILYLIILEAIFKENFVEDVAID